MKYRNYIFDLYGTLIDIHTDETKKKLWKEMAGFYRRMGADYRPGQMQKTYRLFCEEEAQRMVREHEVSPAVSTEDNCPEVVGRAAKDAAAVSNSEVPYYPEIEIGSVFKRLYDEAPKRHAAELSWKDETTDFVAAMFRTKAMCRFQLYPGTIKTLKKIRKEGSKIYLLSNAQHRYTMAELEETELLSYFDGFLISSDEGVRKPSPEFMERLLTRFDLQKSECVMIGNEMASDMQVAAASGVDGIYLNTGHFSEKELGKQVKTLKKTFPHFKPTIIRSGKIEELV